MKSDYFVEFINYEVALKQQESFNFLLEKYKQNLDLINNYKASKIREFDSFINLLELLEADLREFKKLMPSLPVDESIKPVPKKLIKRPSKKRIKSVKPKPRVKPKSDITNIKLGLKKIRDELDNL